MNSSICKKERKQLHLYDICITDIVLWQIKIQGTTCVHCSAISIVQYPDIALHQHCTVQGSGHFV